MFELHFDARLHGPCYRCLSDAVVDLHIDGREYQATNPEGSDELRTPYLADENLDVHGWARDAIALALPEQILCRADCAGLCPMCGKDLNVEPHEHEEEHGDPRWAVLAELRDRLRSPSSAARHDRERARDARGIVIRVTALHGGDRARAAAEQMTRLPRTAHFPRAVNDS